MLRTDPGCRAPPPASRPRRTSQKMMPSLIKPKRKPPENVEKPRVLPRRFQIHMRSETPKLTPAPYFRPFVSLNSLSAGEFVEFFGLNSRCNGVVELRKAPQILGFCSDPDPRYPNAAGFRP